MEALIEEISGIFESSSLRRLHPSILALREKLKTDEVRLAVLGQMKRGKSSLLNALLGGNVLPTGVLPLTSVITEVRYSTVSEARVQYQSGSIEEIAFSELAEYVTEPRNRGNHKRVSALQLFYPCDLLRDGLVLVDTPGFGSTYSHNTIATVGYLSKVDAAIVVFSVDPPITEVEANFIRDVQTDIPRLMIVLNKVDLVSDDEAIAACDFLRDELANRVGLINFEVFPLSTRQPFEHNGDDTRSTGLIRFKDQLHHFARYSHDETLILSILRDVGHVLDLASFALSLSQRFSSLAPAEVEEKRTQMQHLLDDTEREVAAIRSLLRDERLRLMDVIISDLESHVKSSTPYLEKRLADLQRENLNSSGRALGGLLEGFFNEEIDIIFRDWRVQEDAKLSTMLGEIVSRYSARASSILSELAAGTASLVDVPAMNLKVNVGLSMESRVRYSIERIFFSLDSFLLALPPFLQRPLVFRKAMASVPQRLDGNSGRIRFDYLERMEKSFQVMERSLTSQIEDARQTILKALEEPREDVDLWRKVVAVHSCVSALIESPAPFREDKQREDPAFNC